MHSLIRGLHSLFPQNPLYSYSCLVVVNHPDPSSLQTALTSVLNQTAPLLEVIIGFNGPPSDKIKKILAHLEKMHQKKIKCIETSCGPEARLLNLLAEQASGNILIIFDQDGIMRFDLTFRFEQAFRLFQDPERTVVFSKESGGFFPEKRICFPYFFETQLTGCIAIPKVLWKDIGGFDEEYEGSHLYDMFLRLNLANVRMHQTLTCLYNNQKAQTGDINFCAKAFNRYACLKGLEWKIEPGMIPGTLRATPLIKKTISVHAVIPFKNQKELTLAAVTSLQQQTGINLVITAIDNRSEDLSIGKELQEMGVEVLEIDEPFNFSRLNNLAVTRTKSGKHCEAVFFMNNDVELTTEDALLEMCRWIHQPDIGMVGCRLHYPNGMLQHGGIDIDKSDSGYQVLWRHTEHLLPMQLLRLARTLRVTDAVTGAAILMKRELFLDIGGFDEIWYPNGYSDINLAVKLKSKNLHSFYTPFASGIHRESMSRINVGFLEEYESLVAMQHDYLANVPLQRLHPDSS